MWITIAPPRARHAPLTTANARIDVDVCLPNVSTPSQTIADFFLLYIAPKRADYRLFVEHLTPDFGPDTDAEKRALAKVLARKRMERDELMGIVDQNSPFLDDGRISIASINSDRTSALLPGGAGSHADGDGLPAPSTPAAANQTIALTPARFRDLYRDQDVMSPP